MLKLFRLAREPEQRLSDGYPDRSAHVYWIGGCMFHVRENARERNFAPAVDNQTDCSFTCIELDEEHHRFGEIRIPQLFVCNQDVADRKMLLNAVLRVGRD